MVLQDPDIKGFSFSSGIYQALVQPELEDDFRLGVSMRSVDEGFLDFYNLKMLSGVNFSKWGLLQKNEYNDPGNCRKNSLY